MSLYIEGHVFYVSRPTGVQLDSDDIPLFDSTNTQLYPIFGKLNELNLPEDKKMFMLGCL